MAIGTSNPAMNERIFAREAGEEQAGWASPTGSRPVETQPGGAGGGVPPETVSPWTPAAPVARDYPTMTIGGVVAAASVLIALVVAGGIYGYQSVTVTGDSVNMPGWVILPLLGGLGLAFLTIFRPQLARITSPLYAVCEGVLLGAISHVFEVNYKGIILQAVALTIGVFVVMLFLYATRIIKVTEKLRTCIIAATGAIFVVYLVDLVVRLFGGDMGFVHDGGLLGIGFSLLVVGVASFNLLLDFDIADRGVAMGAPKYMNWYAAFGLVVTLVWLYLEILRLLSKLRSR
jgi:uncharacterized YccA/Bax inhibitor family protein